jgi:hypothetical protein
MSDRELLEAAAKAAGVVYRLHDERLFVDGPFDSTGEWNPLTDDGCALRLAVKLGLQLDLRWQRNEVHVYGSERIDEGVGVRDDPLAVTRRAIVRAAAAIGDQP